MFSVVTGVAAAADGDEGRDGWRGKGTEIWDGKLPPERLDSLPRYRFMLQVAGWLMLVGFIVGPARVLVQQAMQAQPPKNPSRPTAVPRQRGIPVFPGAEGFGTRTRAGRGGKVLEVVSLANDGPGTLRAALRESAPRIIVFRVGGLIELTSALEITSPFVTIAGQTAPGDGITLKNAGIQIYTHDVLIQSLRIRPGNEGRVDPDTNNAVTVCGINLGETVGYNIVLDRLSTSWGEDQTITAWNGAHDVTISRCIISEGFVEFAGLKQFATSKRRGT